ncbi:MAG: tyrosine--tRNA ligase [Cuniculiplasma sp.]
MLDLDKNLFEEIVTEEELDSLHRNCKGYLGVEPSGLPHIGSVLVIGTRIGAMMRAGIKMQILLADWHAMINDKLKGDMEAIRRSGELLKKAFSIELGDQKPEFIWASDLIDKSSYMEGIIRTAKQTTLSRLKRSLPIMGRTENDAESDFSKYIYPLMQVNDIFELDLDVALGGMDQRHAHMLARDIAEKMGKKKVVSLHSPLVGSLKGSGRMDNFLKMSKSDPDSAILMTDGEDDIGRKIRGAYCPMGESAGNPLMEILRIIIFPSSRKVIVHRPEKKGGDVEFTDYKSLEITYRNREIHPMDLKEAVTENMVELMKPFHVLEKYLEK